MSVSPLRCGGGASSGNEPGTGGPASDGVEATWWAPRMPLVFSAQSSAGEGRVAESMVGTEVGVVAVVMVCIGCGLERIFMELRELMTFNDEAEGLAQHVQTSASNRHVQSRLFLFRLFQ